MDCSVNKETLKEFYNNYILLALNNLSQNSQQVLSQSFIQQYNKIISVYKDTFPCDCAHLDLLLWLIKNNLINTKNGLISMREIVQNMYDHFDEMYKGPKIFISHATDDKLIVEKFVTMLEQIGVKQDQLFCSSVAGYGIPQGARDLYDFIRKEINNDNLFVILMLSKNYYKSPVCLNEMGATWVKQNAYQSILLPGFQYTEIQGAVNPRDMTFRLADKENRNYALNELKDRIISHLAMDDLSQNRWERIRDGFLIEVDRINGSAHTLTLADSPHKTDSVKKEGIYPEESCNIATDLAENQYTNYCILDTCGLKEVPDPPSEYWRLRLYIFFLKDKSGKLFLPLQLPRYGSILTVPHTAIRYNTVKRYQSVDNIISEVYHLGKQYDGLMKELEIHQFYQMGIFNFNVQDINHYIEYKRSPNLPNQWKAYWVEEVKVTTVESHELINLYDPFYYHGYRYLPINEDGSIDTNSKYVKLTKDKKGIWFLGKPLSTNIVNLIKTITRNTFKNCTYELLDNVLLSELGCILDGD